MPIEKGKVKIYACGPTVYNFAHIGNLRTFIFDDLLRRSLKYLDFEVREVMNITDIDDKTIFASGGDKKKFQDLTKKYEEDFWQNLSSLNIEKPEITPRATEYVEKIAKFVEGLLEKGYAYKGEDGSIYFSISKFSEYGKLSRLDKSGIKAGARVNQDSYTKENLADFVLWKAWDKDDGEIFWNPADFLGAETKLEKGRPGWHIECSVMAGDNLGETLDIHTGAVDLIFPHHENEIAQSEAMSGKKFVNFWLHGEHLLVDGKKMSKSLGNFYTLFDLEKKGFSALDFRYLCLSAHWRDKLNFTWQSLEAARNARLRAKKILTSCPSFSSSSPSFPRRRESTNSDCHPELARPERSRRVSGSHLQKFRSALENDLNLPGALAIFWQMLRDDSSSSSSPSSRGSTNSISADEKLATALEMDKVFGLELGKVGDEKIPENVLELLKKRKIARSSGDYGEADKLREKIEKLGFVVEDSGEESRAVRKS